MAFASYMAVVALASAAAGLSDLRLCADQECQVPVSSGRTVIKFHANQPDLLSFNMDQPVKIFSKGAGRDRELWGVEINGRRGYAYRRHIRETKVMIRDLPFEVPTEPFLAKAAAERQAAAAAASARNNQDLLSGNGTEDSKQAPPPPPAQRTDPVTLSPTATETAPSPATDSPPPPAPVVTEPPPAEDTVPALSEEPTLKPVNELFPALAEDPTLKEEAANQNEEGLKPKEEMEQQQQPQEELKSTVETPVESDDDAAVNDQVVPTEESSDVESLIEHYLEASKDFLPDWLHHVLHDYAAGGGGRCVSPQLTAVTAGTVALLVSMFVARMLMRKLSNEGPLKARLGQLEQALFRARDECALVRKEHDEFIKRGGAQAAAAAVPATPPPMQQPAPPPVNAPPPKELLDEIQALRSENLGLQDRLRSGEDSYAAEVEGLRAEKERLAGDCAQARAELAESQAIVQECLEEKRAAAAGAQGTTEVAEALESLRKQLGNQQAVVVKFEAKLKRRDADIREKTLELRKLRADAANAKLQVAKVEAERDEAAKKAEAIEAAEAAAADSKRELEAVKATLLRTKEDVEGRDSELEAKATEVEVLKVTVEQLKTAFAQINNNATDGGAAKIKKERKPDSDDDAADGNGWDDFDVDEDDDDATSSPSAAAAEMPDFAALANTAQLKVDLRKAQEACERLSEQLIEAETARDTFESRLGDQSEELETARRAKDVSLAQKEEMAKKLDVLTTYFNQRESEMQKQLGVTSNRLTDTETSSESSAKRATLLNDEVESLRAQLRTLKAEMEEQERSLKSQNANLERKQHESWVTVRQESRKSAEAQSELQTLRARLTTVEGKLVEKEFEIKRLMEENDSLKETVENLSRLTVGKSDVYTNGSLSASSSVHNDAASSNASASAAAPVADLPPLPLLPPLPPAPVLVPPPMFPHHLHPGAAFHPMEHARPAPLGGRRSPPPPNRYSRSPSPPPSGPEESYGGNGGGGRRHRNRGDRYSRNISPDRLSNRSGRSDRYD